VQVSVRIILVVQLHDKLIMLLLLLVVLLGWRIMYRLAVSLRGARRVSPGAIGRPVRVRRLQVVLGSGGHTSEMITMLKPMLASGECQSVLYLLADTDSTSPVHVTNLHQSLDTQVHYQMTRIPRSREVGQSYLSACVSLIRAFAVCLEIVYRSGCDHLICNGPGTCIPVCYANYLIDLLCLRGLGWCQITFVESFCRVTSVSLTGKLLHGIVDLYLVQWPSNSIFRTYTHGLVS
jgi:beta-1,4-N-acetylglucosaminyltransferase